MFGPSPKTPEQHLIHFLQSLRLAISCRPPTRQLEVSVADWGRRLWLSIYTVKQEIARLRIIAFPAFIAKSTRDDTPGPVLLLYFLFSTIFIIATPLSNANGYLVFSTMFYYDRTFVGSKLPVMSPENAPSKHVTVVLGVALLAAPPSTSIRYDGQKWSLKGSNLSLWCLYLLIWIYILINLFVLVVY